MDSGSRSPNRMNDSSERVVDLNQAREQKLEEKRRQTERIFFQRFLSVYSVRENESKKSVICPIDLIDVSEEGCAFEAAFDPENPWPNQANEIPIRLYFSQDTYLEIYVRVQNATPLINNQQRFVRYGCIVDRTVKSYPAYQNFIRFLRLYAEYAHKDSRGASS